MSDLSNSGVLIGSIIKVSYGEKSIKLAVDTSKAQNQSCLHFVICNLKFAPVLKTAQAKQKVMITCHLVSGFFTENMKRVYHLYTVADKLDLL